MKKLIFTVTLLAAMATAMQAGAQEKPQQRWWLGGNFGISTNETSGYDISENNSFTFAPEGGYNFSERWGAGLRIGVATAGIRNSSHDWGGGAKDELRSWSVAPFARYNFARWRGVTLFADGGLRFAATDNEVWIDGGSAEGGGYFYPEMRHFGMFVDPGVSVRLVRHISLVARMNIFTAGFTSTSGGSGGDTHTWAASLNSPFDIDGFLDSFILGFNITF